MGREIRGTQKAVKGSTLWKDTDQQPLFAQVFYCCVRKHSRHSGLRPSLYFVHDFLSQELTEGSTRGFISGLCKLERKDSLPGGILHAHAWCLCAPQRVSSLPPTPAHVWHPDLTPPQGETWASHNTGVSGQRDSLHEKVL